MTRDEPNRRRFTRVIASFPIELSDGEHGVSGIIRDLSLKGVYVLCQSPFKAGTAVSVLLRLGPRGQVDEAPIITCEGRVLRNDGTGLALSFLTIHGPDSYNHLRNVILYNAGDPERAAEEIAAFLGGEAADPPSQTDS